MNDTQHNSINVNAECRIFYYYAECRYTECRYAECRGAVCDYSSVLKFKKFITGDVMAYNFLCHRYRG
jgi:hypothetical protein